MKRSSMRKGIGFGLTSSIITTLGLVVGLESGTHSRSVVLGGLLVVAIADGLSDSLGIHISEEAEDTHTSREVWMTTLYTFVSKFFFALTFAVPLLLFDLSTAILASIVWGLSLIILFSYYISRVQNKSALPVIAEHLLISVLVIVITHYVGKFSASFGV